MKPKLIDNIFGSKSPGNQFCLLKRSFCAKCMKYSLNIALVLLKELHRFNRTHKKKNQVFLTCQRNERRVASVLKILIKEFIKEGSILASD